MTITKRKNKNGENSFRIKVSLGYDKFGKQIIKSKTYVPPKGTPAKQAEREAYKQGIIFEEQCERERSSLTRVKFQVLAEEWLELMERTKELKPSTIVRLKSLRERTYQALGDYYIDDISYKIIQSFILSLSKNGVNQSTGKGLSQKTQKHYITFISDVMRYALKCDLIQVNPCNDISTVKTQKRQILPYDLNEAKRLLSRINEEAPLKYKVFFNIIAFSGARRAEIMGLEYKDIDMNTGIIDICRTSNYQSGVGTYTGSTKTDASKRKLYFQPFLIDLIKELKRSQSNNYSDRLFVTNDGKKPMNPNTPYTWLKRFCEKENLSFKGLHAFRHFVATQAIAEGVNIKDISSMLGHSQVTTTLNIYAHTIDKANKNALNAIASSLTK